MPPFFRRLLFFAIVACISGGLLAILGVLALLQYYGHDLPDYSQLAEYNPPTVTRIYSEDGRLMEEYAKQRRLFVPIQSIPNTVKYAFISAEDQNFYEHSGIDFISIVRAAVQNVMHLGTGQGLVGGSTITQQVVKNFLLTNERTVTRKVKEAILAYRISKAYSKDRILELYLNEIFLGGNSYGVAAAALNYFNKSMDQLTIEEAAVLASLPKAPSHLDPRRNPQRARERRDWVISRMEEDGYITHEQAEAARETPIILGKRKDYEVAHADFYAEAVRQKIIDMFGEKNLYEGGLYVQTCVKPRFQQIADRALRAGLEAYDRRHGFRKALSHINFGEDWRKNFQKLHFPALRETWEVAVVTKVAPDRAVIALQSGKNDVIPLSELTWAKWGVKKAGDVLKIGDVVAVEKLSLVTKGKNGYGLRQVPEVNGALVAMDPHTGKVLAMSGGYDFERSKFNRAIQAKRQPGSAFKPFVYLAALEHGFTPGTMIVDGPITMEQGPGLPLWEPKNYSRDFLGPVPIRKGVELSRNAMTARLASMIGIDAVVEIAERFGIVKDAPPQFSIVLGAMETTVMDLASAYAAVVNGGKKVEPALIERIQDRNGQTIYRRDDRKCEACFIRAEEEVATATPPELADEHERIVDEQSAYQIVSIMEGVVIRGTAAKARSIGRTMGGKTGTTNESRDVWFMGFTPDLLVGVFVGYDQPKSLGKKETGASVALPIFIDFMQEALKGQPDVPFRIPPGIRLVNIDKDTGLLPTPATPPKNIVLEAFKAGTEPTSSTPAPGMMDPAQNPDVIPLQPAQPAAPESGTGGIY